METKPRWTTEVRLQMLRRIVRELIRTCSDGDTQWGLMVALRVIDAPEKELMDNWQMLGEFPETEDEKP